MGKPSSSCLKIIACGSDSSVEDGNTESSEAKGSGEKRGWIFRKRSAKHRVLSNNDISSKNLTVGAKDTPQSTSIGSETPTFPTISDKVLALEQPNEKHQPPTSFELKPSKSIELEPSEALDAPKQPEPLGSDVLERVDASEASELAEHQTRVSMGEPESLNTVEQEVFGVDATFALEKPESVEPNICVSVGKYESLNQVESKVPEIEATFSLEPPELVEPTTCVSVGESESLNLIEPQVPKTVTTSSLELAEQVEMKTFEEDVVPKSHVSTESKPLETLVSSQDDNLEEPLIITIQAGVRGFLAQRELVKLRSTIKLQAAIRGHLVRRQAVDTLYCMQGIIKVQNLVRAHSYKANGASVNKHITTKCSTEKLLRNAFARQLLDSTPKSKSTVIKCDPLKPNYAWNWLERWMDVSSSGLSYSETPEIMEEGGEKICPIMECEDLSQVKFESINPEITVEELASKTFEIEKGSISSNPTEEYQPSILLSSEEKMEQTYASIDASFEEPLGMVAQNVSMQSDSHSQPQSGSLSNNLIVETKEPKLSTKRVMALERVDVENKKFAYGSRKASNPAFILAQSKFGVLSSAASNCASSLEGSVHKEEDDPISSAAFIPDETKINIGGSECGTQLSVTSTLDPPDQSEAEVVGMEVKVKSLEGANNLINDEDLEVTTNGHSSVYAPNSYSSTLSQKEIPESNGVPKPVVATDPNQPEAIAYDEHDNGEYVVLNMALDSTKVEQKPERSASDLHVEDGCRIEQPTSEVSLEATPNNNQESQGTPSKQVSVKIKRNQVDKKHGSHSPGKRTVVKALQNSGVRSSGEKLPKDQKSGKRRNSLGSTKYDHIDQEPQSNTSSLKTLPSYMQATQSAKAKAHSPRSSSDMQDKDTNFIKKRQSPAGAGGRQGSPRVQQQPTSQSPQSQVVI